MVRRGQGVDVGEGEVLKKDGVVGKMLRMADDAVEKDIRPIHHSALPVSTMIPSFTVRRG